MKLEEVAVVLPRLAKRGVVGLQTNRRAPVVDAEEQGPSVAAVEEPATVLIVADSGGLYTSPVSARVRNVALYSRNCDSRSGPSSSPIGQCSW